MGICLGMLCVSALLLSHSALPAFSCLLQKQMLMAFRPAPSLSRNPPPWVVQQQRRMKREWVIIELLKNISTDQSLREWSRTFRAEFPSFRPRDNRASPISRHRIQSFYCSRLNVVFKVSRLARSNSLAAGYSECKQPADIFHRIKLYLPGDQGENPCANPSVYRCLGQDVQT